ncbi:MAG: LuxR C-terminal-related transcriptional regulator [Chloroflexi bacterium]|nr:LuxR C-terminal-related transcriptional regulator [Chloroflexota bacterium]
MATPILATKLYIPPPRSKIVLRPRLIERLNEGLSASRKLTLISAPAGFGKTTLVSEWVAGPGQHPPGQVCERLEPKVRVAWLSLDEGDNDPACFLAYLVAALQTIAANIGAGVLRTLQSPQPPSTESILTILLNEITTIPDNFVLVLDDYHVIDAKPVENALAFLLEHLPPQMHLVIATREDPHLPLARLRARGKLTELRAADLRFTPSEAAAFLNQMMGLNLSEEDIAALETRTEGWIAGLQLAAISMQGHQDATSFIHSFTGSHHFVLDYLVEEVLQQQSESIQTFLLRTSILDRMCGPLCDAVLHGDADLHPTPSASGQETLEYLEHANLFIVPLDDERRWYRYHHLFAELLRQRLLQQQSHQSADSSTGDEGKGVAELHIRASVWFEDNGSGIEAFQHAAAANDVERAARLIEGDAIPLHFHGAVTAILNWLESLPTTVLNARPSLWWKHASLLLGNGQTTGVEEKLQAAEAAMQGIPSVVKGPDKTRNLIGQIAAARATLALTRYQPEAMITQARRALEYLPPDNLLSRFRANWTMAMAYHFRGERDAAGRAYTDALSIAQASGSVLNTSLATICLGQIQELENQLHPAAETYRRSLQLLGDYSNPSTSEAYLGLARICYEWNDLDAAEQHGQKSLQLARQYDQVIDRFVISEVFLARLKLARGDVLGAAAMLAETDQSVHQHNFVFRMPEVAAAQVLALLRQGDLAAAAHLAQTHDLPISQARVLLAQGDTSEALAVLAPYRQQMEAKCWQDERLKVMVLQAIAHRAHGEKDKAVHLLGDALALAEPGGFVRLFVDEGSPMAELLTEAAAHGIMPIYVGKLRAAFEAEAQTSEGKSDLSPAQPLVEPLSQRELEILRLIAQGLSNREICERLFLALDTVKGHNRRIFDKLQVQRRTEAVARAHELGLL